MDEIKKIENKIFKLQEELNLAKFSKTTKKKIITIERLIFILIIIGLIVVFAFHSGIIKKINPYKKFEFDWNNSSVRNFENLKMTPYCYHVGDVVDGETLTIESGLDFIYGFGKKPKDFSICSDSEKSIEGPLLIEIFEFQDESSSYAVLENLKSSIIAEKASKTLKLIENENQDIYVGEFTEDNKNKYFYFWNKDRYLFIIIGLETFKSNSLVKDIIQKYTDLESSKILLEPTKDIFTLSCGDNICSSSNNEDCNSCVKDCSCQNNEKCIRKIYTEGYECKISQGNYCSSDYECAEGHCVHNYCRTKSTYCGDNYCDQYDSENPENCGTCLTDCKIEYNQICINNEIKIDNSYSCYYNSDCASNYCVHGTCRAKDIYCGDGYCDYSENKNSCSIDC